jgi:hypothetical protein
MTFLNPALLFGLAAAAIPVILHLLNLRKLRTIDFSTLTFLKELQQSKVRRLKLRQILLLIVRTLMVIFIVLAFARPAMRGSLPSAFGSGAGSTIAIVLDDSYSMSAADESGERFSRARQAALNILSLLKEGDAAYFLKLSDLPRITVEPATHDFGLLADIISKSKPSYVTRTQRDGLAAAVRLMEASQEVNREIYLVSDFQKTSLGTNAPISGPGRGTAPADSSRIPATLAASDAPDPRVRLFLVGIGMKEIDNSSVDSVEVLSRIFEKNKPVEVSAVIRNYGRTALRDAVVSVFDGDTRVAQSNLTVEPGSSRPITLSFVPRRSGLFSGRVVLEPDELDVDNTRYFSFAIPARVRVLVAGAGPEDTRFLLPALKAGTVPGQESMLEIVTARGKGPGAANLRDFDVLVLAGVPAFDQAEAGRIREFVTGGGGLVIFPGPESDATNYNTRLLGPMNLPVIRGTTGGGDAETGLYFREIDFDHPLFSTIFEKKAAPGDSRKLSPSILRTLDLRGTPQSRSIISLSNGNGFLIEQPVGAGRVAIFSAAPLLSWSDFPMKGLFAPLLYRTVVYLATGSERPAQFTVGGELNLTLRRTPAASTRPQYSLRLPDGVDEIVTPSPSPTGVLFRYSSPALPGQYELRSGPAAVALCPVNLLPAEADLRPATDDDVDSLLSRLRFTPDQARRLTAGGELPARIIEARIGTELWKYCLLLVLLLAMVEMFFNRHARGETTSET